MKEKIDKFLKSGKENYLEFIAELFPADPKQILINSKKMENFKEIPFPKRKFLENGIYDNVCELDFIAFSFSLMKKYAKNKELVNFIKIIENLNQHDYRVKRLRVRLFNSLHFVYCSLFDIDLYKMIERKMHESINKVIDFIEKKQKNIYGIGYDSVDFGATREQGVIITNQLNDILETPVRLRYYKRVVKFYNVSYWIDDNNSTTIRRLTRTPEKYEKLKIRIINALLEKDIKTALSIIDLNKELKTKKLDEYRKAIHSLIIK